METKHTPGPWEFRKDGYVYSLATGERVCSPHSTLDGDVKISQHLKDLKKNARLIAAAPELLNLLIESRSTLEMWKDVAPAVSLCADIDKLVEKATGSAA